MTSVRPAFLPLWTLAVAATVSAFVVHLALRGRTVELGYELGHSRQEQSRLREVRRVLELEAASYKTPERVEIVARSLLGMEPPPPDRIVALPQVPSSGPQVTVDPPSAPVVGLNAAARPASEGPP
jgi:cell division protein FtsL